jgi:hypothetical protein
MDKIEKGIRFCKAQGRERARARAPGPTTTHPIFFNKKTCPSSVRRTHARTTAVIPFVLKFKR